MHYKISYTYPNKRLIDINFTVKISGNKDVILYLPTWRPGRYELQHYARNVVKFTAKNDTGKILKYQKLSNNCWSIQPEGSAIVNVSYSYHCQQMDAGGSWLDENLIYLNFINFLMWHEDAYHDECTVELLIPEDYKIACGLPLINRVITANDFFHLADSPLIASKELHTHTYHISDTTFFIHFYGVKPEFAAIENDFKRFSETQLQVFGSFPEKAYHFLNIILPYPFYHGVEHRNSTVIVLGPVEDFDSGSFYNRLLGISSHELFHTWNICKIRPLEMFPYDLKKENYFPTGFVAEGVTTYYGDLMLARAGVWDFETYFRELSDNLQKHMSNPGKNYSSLIQSSYDLWIDGYQKSHPYRKVSIYDKGALVALILDLYLRKETGNKVSLDTVMKYLWEEFALKSKGYSYDDYKSTVEKVSGKDFKKYFDDCVEGVTPLERILAHQLDHVGCVVEISHNPVVWESSFGLKLSQSGEKIVVTAVDPGSPADKVLSVNDEILEVNKKPLTPENLKSLFHDKQMLELHISSAGKHKIRTMLKDGASYFNLYSIKKSTSASDSQKLNYKKWLNQEF